MSAGMMSRALENIAAKTLTITRMKTTSANMPSVIDVRNLRASG